MKKIKFNSNKNIIHAQLRRIRMQNGLSQRELADRMSAMNVHIDQQMVSRIENNDRIVTDYELACLCIALNVCERDLFSEFYALHGK